MTEKKKNKRTNNVLHRKLKIKQHDPTKKQMNPGAPEGLAVPVPLVIFLSGLVPFALVVSEKENKI
jgi:hypothetical protein